MPEECNIMKTLIKSASLFSEFPLPNVLRQQMEYAFNADFSDVRVIISHIPELFGAHAFAYGSYIFLAPNAYRPDCFFGQFLLAHELTHVLQQRHNQTQYKSTVQLENEADCCGLLAAKGMVIPWTHNLDLPAIQQSSAVIQFAGKRKRFAHIKDITEDFDLNVDFDSDADDPFGKWQDDVEAQSKRRRLNTTEETDELDEEFTVSGLDILHELDKEIAARITKVHSEKPKQPLPEETPLHKHRLSKGDAPVRVYEMANFSDWLKSYKHLTGFGLTNADKERGGKWYGCYLQIKATGKKVPIGFFKGGDAEVRKIETGKGFSWPDVAKDGTRVAEMCGGDAKLATIILNALNGKSDPIFKDSKVGDEVANFVSEFLALSFGVEASRDRLHFATFLFSLELIAKQATYGKSKKPFLFRNTFDAVYVDDAKKWKHKPDMTGEAFYRNQNSHKLLSWKEVVKHEETLKAKELDAKSKKKKSAVKAKESKDKKSRIDPKKGTHSQFHKSSYLDRKEKNTADVSFESDKPAFPTSTYGGKQAGTSVGTGPGNYVEMGILLRRAEQLKKLKEGDAFRQQLVQEFEDDSFRIRHNVVVRASSSAIRALEVYSPIDLNVFEQTSYSTKTELLHNIRKIYKQLFDNLSGGEYRVRPFNRQLDTSMDEDFYSSSSEERDEPFLGGEDDESIQFDEQDDIAEQTSKGEIVNDRRRYGDDDISTYVNAAIRHELLNGFVPDHSYVLRGVGQDPSINPFPDENGEHYIVAVTPAIDSTGLGHIKHFKKAGAGNVNLSSINIAYHLAKNTRPKDVLEVALEAVLAVLEEGGDITEVRKKIEEITTNTENRMEVIRGVVDDNEEDLGELQTALQTLLEVERPNYVDVFDEIMPALMKGDENHAKILFPFNITQAHWLVGEIIIDRDGNNYSVKVFAHDPFGGGQIPSEEAISDAIVARISNFDEDAEIEINFLQSPYTRRQKEGDGVSCGVIAATDLIKRITGKNLKIPQPYPIGAKELRSQQIETVRAVDGGDLNGFIARNTTGNIGQQSTKKTTKPTKLKSSSYQTLLSYITAIKDESLKETIIDSINDTKAFRQDKDSYAANIANLLVDLPIARASKGEPISSRDSNLVNKLYFHFFATDGACKGNPDAIFGLTEIITPKFAETPVTAKPTVTITEKPLTGKESAFSSGAKAVTKFGIFAKQFPTPKSNIPSRSFAKAVDPIKDQEKIQQQLFSKIATQYGERISSDVEDYFSSNRAHMENIEGIDKYISEDWGEYHIDKEFYSTPDAVKYYLTHAKEFGEDTQNLIKELTGQSSVQYRR